ncbi:MAG: AIR synthase family protein [Anaerolineae bacterium]|jgi:hydrogenase maturation factor|nr:AIR synthase family protein [Anaerolineae bacterium]
MTEKLPLGKLPPELLERLVGSAPILDPRVILGPGIGLDCAVVNMGNTLLVFKSDPITFATDEIGWYSVQVCANDIATMGAKPRWMLTTLMLPEEKATEADVTEIHKQLQRACQSLNISLIGGHTEVTHGIDRPIIASTMVGEVAPQDLVTQQGAKPGNAILLTKGIPVEATAILSREFPQLLKDILTPMELRQAQDYLFLPGISITMDAEIAVQHGKVTAMHDPTEGGLAAALWELSIASAVRFLIQPEKIIVPELSHKICEHFGLDPLATIASGALLMTCEAADAPAISHALNAEGIPCSQIGEVISGQQGVYTIQDGKEVSLPRPERDEIARFYEEHA